MEAVEMCSTKNLGIRLGALFAGISIVCGIVIYSWPGLASSLLEYLTHSSWQYTIKPFDPIRFVGGAALWFLIGNAIGLAFSKMCGNEKGEAAHGKAGSKRKKSGEGE